MKTEEALKSLELKFSSGNKIPVTQATITVEEYEAIRKFIGPILVTVKRSGGCQVTKQEIS